MKGYAVATVLGAITGMLLMPMLPVGPPGHSAESMPRGYRPPNFTSPQLKIAVKKLKPNPAYAYLAEPPNPIESDEEATPDLDDEYAAVREQIARDESVLRHVIADNATQ